MDVYLTGEAFLTLAALRRLAAVKGTRGFLLGHRRGDRVYIESVLPSPAPAWPDLKSFYDLDAGLDRGIFGFFLFGPSPSARKALLQPFGTGKVLIEISGRRGKKPILSASVIDYRDRFVFRKIALVVERPAR